MSEIPDVPRGWALQAVLFNHSYYTNRTARAWLKARGYKPIKPPHRTKTYLRFRIRDPDEYSRFISVGEGAIRFVIGRRGERKK